MTMRDCLEMMGISVATFCFSNGIDETDADAIDYVLHAVICALVEATAEVAETTPEIIYSEMRQMLIFETDKE